jgi:glycerate dehydrogenase
VLDEEAVADAVESGKLGFFGCDVYSTEPMPASHPYFRIKDRENVCLTPHMAWGAYEARERCMNEIYKNIRAFLEGEKRNRIV